MDPHLKKAIDTQFTLPCEDQARRVLLLGGNGSAKVQPGICPALPEHRRSDATHACTYAHSRVALTPPTHGEEASKRKGVLPALLTSVQPGKSEVTSMLWLNFRVSLGTAWGRVPHWVLLFGVSTHLLLCPWLCPLSEPVSISPLCTLFLEDPRNFCTP